MIAVEQDVIEEIRQTARDGALFVRRVLRHHTWSRQEEVIRSLLNNPRTAVAGCHASSKSFAAAESAIAWNTRYPDGVVIVTAPTFTQGKIGIWAEIRKALQAVELIEYPEPGADRWQITDANYAILRAAAKGVQGVRFQGFHSGHVLILVDEAPGVDAEIYEAIEGIRAGGTVHVGVFGNPTVPGGYFYDCFTKDRAQWHCIRIDGLDTPNLEGITLEDILQMPLDKGGPLDENPWPYLITRRYVREMLEFWGEDNPRFQARVRGQFPQHAEDALIPLQWLEDARNREVRRTGQRVTAGIDVAGGGRAENVLYILDKGHVVTPEPIVSTKQPDQATGDIVAALKDWRKDLGPIRYDSIGVGNRLGTIIRSERFDAVGVNVGEQANDKERFVLRRDELFWQLRELFREGKIAGLVDETTMAQLAAIRYEHTARGKIQVESKKDMAARGVKSMDRADAFMLAATAEYGGIDSIPQPSSVLRTRTRLTPT